MQALTLDGDSRLRLGENRADAIAEIAFGFEHPVLCQNSAFLK